MIWTALLSTVLVINEVMSSNLGEAMSPAINYDSWIELYNPGTQAVNLGGMTLSDHYGNTWQMPSNMGNVPAQGFTVVWLGSNEIKETQATFKLDCDGGTVTLTDKSGNVVATQEYPEAKSRTAWARKTDGGEEWGWTSTPTPGESNATATFATKRLDPPVVSVGSKLFTGTLKISVDIPEGATLMYTTDGSLPSAPKPEDPGNEPSPWTQYVKNGDCEGSDASCFVCRDGNATGDDKDVHRITDGVGVDGSRGITVHSVKDAANEWTTQFFVYTPDHVWKTGEHYRFHMKVRADKATHISVQAHKTPGDYIWREMMDTNYEVFTEWTDIDYEGDVTSQQAGEETSWGGGGWGGWGGWGGQPTTTYSLQTIAFNLNQMTDSDNNFYFDEISWESMGDDAEEPDPTQKSEDGEFTISKTTNYTFRLYRDGYLPSVPVTRSYIQTSNKYTLPVVSIVGDKKYFTDPKTGIDCDGDGTNGAVASYTNGQKKNFAQDWDRPVNFSYLNSNGEMLHNQDVNIKVSGGYTRTQRFRSFKLKASKAFDGQNRYDYSFFPQKPFIRSKTLLVRNGGNDIWENNARFMDPALETIIQRSGLNLDVQSYQPVIEYVNGELRGVMNLREPNNDDYAYANWGYDDEELDALENMTMKNGDNVAINRIFELGQAINTPGAYDELKTLLDIDEFTNYMAVTLFLYNDDWPDNNIKAYRSRLDGRYRFVSYDLDYAFKGCWDYSSDDPFVTFVKFKDDSTAPRTSYNKDIVNLFLNLLGHDDYRRLFIDTFCLVGGSVFEPNRANEIVDELLAVVQPMAQLMRQQGLNEGHDPDRAATSIKNNLNKRADKMTNYLQKFSYVKLNDVKRQQVALGTDTEGARIFVNGIEVPYADFDGYMFAPVVLGAIAPTGYRFAGWKNADGIVSDNPTFKMPADASIALMATFTPLTDDEKTEQGIAPVRINEVSAANEIYVNDYWKRNDWVELYNTTDKAIDVAGMYLTDNLKKPTKYKIAAGTNNKATIIQPHGYLIIWCDKLEPLTELHAEFKLAAEGGDVMITAADESWSDRLTYIEHKGDQTVGRYPDGTDNVYVMNLPTIDKANATSSYIIAVDQPNQTGIANTTTGAESPLTAHYSLGRIVIQSTALDDLTIRISNLAGQQVTATTLQPHSNHAEMAVSELSDGVYIATVSDKQGNTATCKFVKH